MGEVKVNLGCGTSCIDGWVNVDSSINARLAKHPLVKKVLYRSGILSKQLYTVPWRKDILIRDITKKLPFDDGSVDFIYSAHMLEHLARNDADALLKECYRVLKSGGIIRLAVPDLEKPLLRYLVVRDADALIASMGMGEDRAWNPIEYYLFKNNYHRWMYDYKSLKRLLEKHHFVSVEKKEFRKSAIPDIYRLESMSEDLYGISNGLFVEAAK